MPARAPLDGEERFTSEIIDTAPSRSLKAANASWASGARSARRLISSMGTWASRKARSSRTPAMMSSKTVMIALLRHYRRQFDASGY